MPEYRKTLEINSSKQRVWQYVSDIRLYPLWAKAVKKVTIHLDTGSTLGLKANVLIEERGQELAFDLETVEYIPEKKIRFKALTGFPRLIIDWTLEPLNSRTKLTFTAVYDLPSYFTGQDKLQGWAVLDLLRVGDSWKNQIVDRILRKGLDRELQTLKALLEGEKIDEFARKWSY